MPKTKIFDRIKVSLSDNQKRAYLLLIKKEKPLFYGCQKTT